MEHFFKKFKVGSHFYPQVRHKYVVHPKIQLAGKWLQRIGFEAGSLVDLHCTDGKIIITLDRSKRPRITKTHDV